MKTRTLSSAGALHPVLFFAGFYAIVLLFSIFICSSLFYSCNTSKAETANKQDAAPQQTALVMSSNTGAVTR
ncbi:MAG TPA: hypothetical protein VET23_14550 [Chitinophagaceae bacterium]|nr:hypothetical protein [Chitinophagaceae bacterium]